MVARTNNPAATGRWAPERNEMAEAGTPRADAERLTVLLTQTDHPWSQQLPQLLQPQGVYTIRVGDVEQAIETIERQLIHAAVVDVSLPMEHAGPVDGSEHQTGGLKLLRVMQRIEPSPPVVVVRDRRFDRVDERLLAEALKLHAFSVLDEPVELEQLLEVLRRLLKRYYGGSWPGAPRPPAQEQRRTWRRTDGRDR